MTRILMILLSVSFVGCSRNVMRLPADKDATVELTDTNGTLRIAIDYDAPKGRRTGEKTIQISDSSGALIMELFIDRQGRANGHLVVVPSDGPRGHHAYRYNRTNAFLWDADHPAQFVRDRKE